MSESIKGTIRSGMTITPKRISIIGWTPVEEALPEESWRHYLVWINDGLTGYPTYSFWDGETWNYNSCELLGVTHWAEFTPPETCEGKE